MGDKEALLTSPDDSIANHSLSSRDSSCDISSVSSRSSSTRASEARKHLPKNLVLKCQTIMRLFMFALTDDSTKDIMMAQVSANDKFQNKLDDIQQSRSQEIKQVQKTMRQLYALRSKGYKKIRVLRERVKELTSKYSMRKVESLTGMTYRQIYRIMKPPLQMGGERKITREHRLSVYKVVLQTVHTMQIPYRRFAKYFYLRESIKDTYTAYCKEQEALGLRILSQSGFYKNLPKNVRSQKYIPFMECLCVKCLNFAHFVEAIRSAGVQIDRRGLFSIISSVCPFLVHKDDISSAPKPLKAPVQTSPDEDENVKKPVVQFGNLEKVFFDKTSLKSYRNVKTRISNDVSPTATPKKHDPNYYLISADNAPSDITTEVFVRNAKPACIFRDCSDCGVKSLFNKMAKDNPHLGSSLSKPVVWYKWTSFVEKLGNGEKVKRPFDRYRFDGTLQELIQVYYSNVHNMSKHYFHFKWQAYQYEQFRSSIKLGEVGIVMDFGQNINHKKQIEAQSTHFNRRQSTIFPLVCFFPCTLCNSLVTHEICCITDDLKHDAFAVRAFELQAIQILKATSVQVNHVYEWCDNCGLEFKSKLPFDVLSRMDIPITRNYWGENHGKGPADAVIGRVSQFIRSAIARGKTAISHGVDMALYLQTQKGTANYNPGQKECQHYRQTFAYVDAISRTGSNKTVQTLKGTREIHCVCNTGVPGILKVRRSSCLCRCNTLATLYFLLFSFL